MDLNIPCQKTSLQTDNFTMDNIHPALYSARSAVYSSPQSLPVPKPSIYKPPTTHGEKTWSRSDKNTCHFVLPTSAGPLWSTVTRRLTFNSKTGVKFEDLKV